MNGDAVKSVEPCKAEEHTGSKLADGTGASGAGDLRVEPIIMELDERSASACLNMPARPNDEVVVPPAGQVGVYGWVSRPGTFDITPGMTVLGAVTAAGGAMYSSNVEVLRKDASGERSSVPMDLSKLEDGRSADIPVQAGDLIVVRSSALGIVPYTVTQILHFGFGSGMYFPAF
jgi:polysaccharide export outer membrane protein